MNNDDYCLISDAWEWMEPYFVNQGVASDSIDALKKLFYEKMKANERLPRSVYGYGDFYITECEGMPFVIILSTEGTSEYWSELKKHLCVKGNEGRTVMFNFMYRNGDSRKAYFTSVVSDDLSDLELRYHSGVISPNGFGTDFVIHVERRSLSGLNTTMNA